jgi:hypothetical protein
MSKLDEVLAQNLKPAFEQTGDTTIPPTTITSEPVVTPPSGDTVTTQPTNIEEFNLDHFNKHFGKEFKKADEIKSLFDLQGKVTEYEGKLTEYEKTKLDFAELQKKYEEVGRFVDPNSFFANDEIRRTNEMLMKYPDKDTTLMTRIGSLDIDKTDNFELLVLNEMLQNPSIEGGEAGARELLASEFGIDIDDKKSWDTLTKNKISKEANKVKTEFKNLQKIDPKLPIDVEKMKSDLISRETAKIEATKGEWKPLMDKALQDFKELTIFDSDEKGDLKELYKYQVEYSDEDKKTISEDMINYLAYTGQTINEKTVKDSLDMIKGKYVLSQLPKMMKSYGQQIATQKDDEWHQKVNNTNPLSDKVPPTGDIEKEIQSWTSAIRGS